MRIFLTGASGAIGRPLVPRLLAVGHEVVGTTTTEAKVEPLRELGAEPMVVDLLDPDAVGEAVAAADPDAIIHEATALASGIDPRHLDRDFAITNRLRTEGTDHLLAAGRAAGIERFVAQSFTGWTWGRNGGRLRADDEPNDPDPPKKVAPIIAAVEHLEAAVTSAAPIVGTVLRYGGFYGPGTSLELDPPGEQVEAILKRQYPVVGGGRGVWSFVHVDDAADATVLALTAPGGVYNVVDDDPVQVAELLPAIAERVGAAPPRRVPRWIGRLFAGEAAAAMMCDVRGASNAKAKRELGWEPAHPSWRTTLAG